MTSASGKPVMAILAGGTGGHIFPALAVGRQLQQQGAELVWLGTRRGLEADIVPKQQIPLLFIEIEGVRGRGVIALLKAPFLLLKAILSARKLMRANGVTAALGMGGFVAGPGGVAAKTLGIPLVIHEQNAIAGTTNKLLAKIANRRFVAFPNALPNSEWCGNPVRADVAAVAEPEQRLAGRSGAAKLLVLGGSRGALAINKVVPLALAQLADGKRPEVWHQSGQAHHETTVQAYAEADVSARVEPFIDDMAAAYAWADFVVCRAGALTVAELAAVGLAAILIPFPYAIDDHQTVNGQWLVDNGSAVLMQERDMTIERLASAIASLTNEPARRLAMAQAGRKLARTDADQTVAGALLEVANG